MARASAQRMRPNTPKSPPQNPFFPSLNTCDARHRRHSQFRRNFSCQHGSAGSTIKARLEPGDTRQQWTGKPLLVSLVRGTPVVALPTSSAGYWFPTTTILCSTASASEASFSFGGDFFRTQIFAHHHRLPRSLPAPCVHIAASTT
jgi:hypothetical protein